MTRARTVAMSVLLTATLPLWAMSVTGQSLAKKDAPASENDTKRRAILEAAFEATMTDVTFEGTWRMTGKGGLTAREPLGEAATDKYTIVGVTKGVDDFWIVNARIQFGEKDVTVPIPVRVVWAGDTPVITLDNLPVPLIGTYSARVMIHNGFYSGIWYSNGKNYGGVMSGRIVKQSPKARTQGVPKAINDDK